MSDTTYLTSTMLREGGTQGLSAPGYYPALPAQERLDESSSTLKVNTTRFRVTVLPRVSIQPDFEVERTLEYMAAQQRIFLATVPDDMLDIELPIDD